MKSSIQRPALQALGTRPRRLNDWISSHTIQLANAARQARLAQSSAYRDLRRQATRSARNDRCNYWNEMATKTEAAANLGNTTTLFRLIRSASGKNQVTHSVLRSAFGELISDAQGKMSR
ncbi:unnamed protein product [Echinostoma caproni]|uniref:Transposase n=1 Tax=Echinostoma caproni TaxID=27848 RepID=A0A183AUF8_9TREM|nr:unnamed protein product [Echinostoma caproni]